MSEFNLGDRVQVTGDTDGAGHEFDAGTVGVITAEYDGEYRVGHEYRVVAPDGDDGEEAWWVYDVDLVKVDSGPQTSHAMFLAATRTVLDLNLPEHVKTVIIKAMVDAL